MRARWLIVSTGSLLLVALIAFFIAAYRLGWAWTGFASQNSDTNHAKTLWDWLNLLGVFAIPIVVGFGSVWLTRRHADVSEAENKDNQRADTLQSYLNNMSELLLHEHLRTSAEGDEVRSIARVRTLTVLRGLDAARKATVLQFLYESKLIEKDKPIVHISEASFNGADLSEMNLRGANLQYVDLSNANLRDTNLLYANLRGADLFHASLHGTRLRGSDLREVNLSEADLTNAQLVNAVLFGAKLHKAKLYGASLEDAILNGASLRDAVVSPEQLTKAKSLVGTTLPDGSKHA